MQTNYNKQGKDSQKEQINYWIGMGTVRPRAGADTIQFYQFKNGGGAINFSLLCTQVKGADANGQAITTTVEVPVKAVTNRSTIDQQQLLSIQPGMRIRVKGALKNESYESKRTGSQITRMIVNAYYLEILEMPRQMPQGGYASPPGYAVQAGQYPPVQGYQQPVTPQAPAYPAQMPPQAPAYTQPAQTMQPQAPAYDPRYGGYPAPAQATGTQPQPPAYGQQQAPAYAPRPQAPAPQQQAPVPPYYQPAPQPSIPGMPQDDLPADDLP